MKRNDFIQSLQHIRSQIIDAQKKPEKITFQEKVSREKGVCTCRDSNGQSKYLYHSQQELEYLLSSTHISLTNYPCPYEKGWHLTKG